MAVHLDATGPADRPRVRPMLLSSDAEGARVSLVPEGALLLAGDAVHVEVTVGVGLRLELVEPAGTVAYAMHGGRASWHVGVELAASSSLTWAGEPFVVAEGAQVDRWTSVRLAPGATAALRDVVVFGRHGERPGILTQRLEVDGPDGVALLRETFEIGHLPNPVLLGSGRAIGTVTVLGTRLPAGQGEPGTRFDLEGEGTLVRRVSADAHRSVDAATWRAARAAAN